MHLFIINEICVFFNYFLCIYHLHTKFSPHTKFQVKISKDLESTNVGWNRNVLHLNIWIFPVEYSTRETLTYMSFVCVHLYVCACAFVCLCCVGVCRRAYVYMSLFVCICESIHKHTHLCRYPSPPPPPPQMTDKVGVMWFRSGANDIRVWRCG